MSDDDEVGASATRIHGSRSAESRRLTRSMMHLSISLCKLMQGAHVMALGGEYLTWHNESRILSLFCIHLLCCGVHNMATPQ